MKNLLLVLPCLLFFASLSSQTRIDATLSFQSDPAKQYSIYIPSNYDPAVPNKLMLGLHPLNVNRWNSISWCDTLINFAETNDLLLICPDGGADGQVDGAIDTAFTSFILDSMLHWYNVDESKIFAMGFSWGGRTTYTYGLNHVEKFAGFIPIGAAITNLNEVGPIVDNAVNKPFYIIHGNNDNPAIRFFPVRDALEDTGACVATELMPGVGHTIDFANRDAILTEAFQWVDSSSCALTSLKEIRSIDEQEKVMVYPNPVSKNGQLNFLDGFIVDNAVLVNQLGQQMQYWQRPSKAILLNNISPGLYHLKAEMEGNYYIQKIIVQ